MVMKTDSDIVQIFTPEDVIAFLSGMKDDMPLVVAKLFGKITPFPEYQIGVRLPFPDTDGFGVGKIGNQIGHRKQ